jgi:transcriptional repressor NrdR
MFCPSCGFQETVVKDSRISDDGKAIRRRRYCPDCDSRFTTYERAYNKEFMVIKKSGEKEFFDLEKITHSLKMALRKRNVEIHVIDKFALKIYHELSILNDNDISSQKIGEIVMRFLQDIDQVAFVRFASVYKNFNSAEDFKKFIKSL